MMTRNLERRIARLERARPDARRIDLSGVPTAELETVIVIAQRHGVDSWPPTGQQSALAQKAAMAEILDKCPELRAACQIASS